MSLGTYIRNIINDLEKYIEVGKTYFKYEANEYYYNPNGADDMISIHIIDKDYDGL